MYELKGNKEKEERLLPFLTPRFLRGSILVFLLLLMVSILIGCAAWIATGSLRQGLINGGVFFCGALAVVFFGFAFSALLYLVGAIE